MREMDDITGAVVEASLRIHGALGPGSAGLRLRGRPGTGTRAARLSGERQKVIRFEYEGMVFEEGSRADLVVDDRVIVEV